MAASNITDALRNGINAADEDLAGIVAGLETVKVLTDRLQRRHTALRSMVAPVSSTPTRTRPSAVGTRTDAVSTVQRTVDV